MDTMWLALIVALVVCLLIGGLMFAHRIGRVKVSQGKNSLEFAEPEANKIKVKAGRDADVNTAGVRRLDTEVEAKRDAKVTHRESP